MPPRSMAGWPQAAPLACAQHSVHRPCRNRLQRHTPVCLGAAIEEQWRAQQSCSRALRMRTHAKKQQFTSFDDMLQNSETPLLVDFFATWCGPCVMMANVLEVRAAVSTCNAAETTQVPVEGKCTTAHVHPVRHSCIDTRYERHLWVAILSAGVQEVAPQVRGKVSVVKIDTEKYPKLAARYGIEGLPTLCLFKKGQVVQRFEGFMSAQQLLQGLAPHTA